MSKSNWRRVRYSRPSLAVDLVTGEVLPMSRPLTKKLGATPNNRGKSRSADICIVVGSDRSPTGQRQAFIFSDAAAARRADFPWVI